MRARQRHFNAKDIGASGVYDSRYISGLSNNDVLGTWSSRTGTNNATQSTEASKPTYKTNQLNGNPVVEFDGSNDFLEFSKLNGSAAWALCVVKRTSTNTFQTYLFITNTAGTNPTLAAAVHNDAGYGPVIVGNSGNLLYAKGGTLSQDTWRSLFVVWLGGGSSGATYYNAWDNGNAVTLGNSSFVGNAPKSASYIAADAGPWGGQMALVVFAFASPSGSVRKRVNHAAGYSFKIACS